MSNEAWQIIFTNSIFCSVRIIYSLEGKECKCNKKWLENVNLLCFWQYFTWNWSFTTFLTKIFLTDFNRGCSSIGSSRNFRMSMSDIDRTQVHIVLICLAILSCKTDFLRRRCWSSSVAGYWARSSAWALSIVPVELVHGEILRCLILWRSLQGKQKNKKISGA